MLHKNGITHPLALGYIFWLFGFTGSHRFYFGRPITGIIWALTGGLFLIGWIIDLFLMDDLADQANNTYRQTGQFDYSITFVLLVFLGVFGAHRFYLGKIFSGLLYLFTFGFFGIGYLYDLCTYHQLVLDANSDTHI